MSSPRNKRKSDKINETDRIQLATPRATPEPGASSTSHRPPPVDRAARAKSDHQKQDPQSESTNTAPRNDSPQNGPVPTIHVEGSSYLATEGNGTVPALEEDHENSEQDDLSDGMDLDEKTAQEIVEEIIREKENEQSTLEMTKHVIDLDTNLQNYHEFFDEINKDIRAKCLIKKVTPDGFLLPDQAHEDALRSLRTSVAPYRNTIVSDSDQQAILEHCTQTYDNIKSINTSHNLPMRWNINIEETVNAIKAMSSSQAMENSSTAAYDLDEDDLDALESRTRKDQNQFSSCKVINWWPKGTGTQTFVQYGDESAPLYRIRAGSYEHYDKSSVPRLWTTDPRGTQKETVRVDGVKKEENWKWTRSDIQRIIAVGWKVPDDDDAEIDALSLIKPERGATYPQTKCMILWKDGETTLEGRSFMRRIANGPAFRGDQMIYQKAKELEAAYEERNGPLQGGRDLQKEEDESGDSSSDLDDMGTYSSDRELSFTGSKQKGRPNHRKDKHYRRGSSNRDDAIIKVERLLAKLKSNRKGSRSQRD